MDTTKLVIGQDVYMVCGPCSLAKGKVVEIVSSGVKVQVYPAFSDPQKEPAVFRLFNAQGECHDITSECGTTYLTDDEELAQRYERAAKLRSDDLGEKMTR